jgi:hypothetical protein
VNALRIPVVIGLHPGAGASTVATALHAHEGGGGAADVVCVDDHALGCALAIAPPPAVVRPVLAIRAAGAPGPPPRALGFRFGAVVVVPHLACWSGVAAPSDEIALLLGLPPAHLPAPLRAYAAAMRGIAAAVVGSGQLTLPSPPLLRRAPVRRAPVLPPLPAAIPVPASRPELHRRSRSVADGPDDEALEAAGFAVAGRAG